MQVGKPQGRTYGIFKPFAAIFGLRLPRQGNFPSPENAQGLDLLLAPSREYYRNFAEPLSGGFVGFARQF